MNSDEPQTQESNPEQQPILEEFDENSLEPKPETESSEPSTDSSDESDVTQTLADRSKALDLPAPDDNKMTPSRDQQETVANLTQTIADLEVQEQQLRQ
ncbi:MAG: DUF3086 domain-containing protein, partial [Coleofasciculus sp. C2-GNP5-27]